MPPYTLTASAILCAAVFFHLDAPSGEALDGENDAAVDMAWNHTRDANGQVIRAERDHDVGGVSDRVGRFLPVADEETITHEQTYDYNQDGIADRMIRSSWKGNTDLSREVFDYNADGSLRRADRRLFKVEGRMNRREIDRDGDGTVEWIEVKMLDPSGRVVGRKVDRNGDGAMDWSVRYTLDGNDNVVRRASDHDGDGAADRIKSYVLDADGRTVQAAIDEDGDGAPDRVGCFLASGRVEWKTPKSVKQGANPGRCPD